MRKKQLAAAVLAGFMAVGSLAGCAKSESVSEELASPAASQSSSNETTEGDTKEEIPEETYTLANLDPQSMDYNKYVDVTGWKDTEVKKEDVIEDELAIQYGFVNALKSIGVKEVDCEDEDKKLEVGDTAVIDFKGYFGDEAFEGGEGSDFPLGIGSGQFIPGFESQLIGVKAGESKDVVVNFPESYPSKPDYAGKEATFKVKVKSIKCLETVTDEAFKKLTEDKFDNIAAYETYYKENRAESYKDDVVWSKVMNNIKRNGVCQELADDFVNTYLCSFSMYANSYGVKLSDFLTIYGYGDVESFKKSIKETSEEYAAQTCAVLAIAESENIKADQEEVDKQYKEALEEYENKEDSLKEAGITKESIAFDNILDQVQKLVRDTIKVVE